jgi:signal peptidase I
MSDKWKTKQDGWFFTKKGDSFFSWANIKEIIALLTIVFLIRTFGFGLYQVPSGSMETTMLVGERFFADKFTYLFSAPKRGDIISMNEPIYNYSDNTLKRLFEEYVWGPSNWTKRVIGLPGETVEGKIEDGRAVIYINGEKFNEPYLNKYPLIGVYKVDPSRLFQQVRRGCIDVAFLNDVATSYSYDPNVSYRDQPFYRINPKRIMPSRDGGPQLAWPNDVIEPREHHNVIPGESYWDGSDVFHVELGKDEYWCMGDNRRGSKDCRCFGPIKRGLIHGKILFLIWSLDSDESWWILDLIKHPIDFWSRIRWNRCLRMMH